jgi:hypothetical protein
MAVVGPTCGLADVRHRHLRPGGSSVTGTCGLADGGVLGDACARRGSPSVEAAPASGRPGPVPPCGWPELCPGGLRAGTWGVGLGQLASAAAAPAAAVAAVIAPEAVARGSGLGGVQRCAGGAFGGTVAHGLPVRTLARGIVVVPLAVVVRWRRPCFAARRQRCR